MPRTGKINFHTAFTTYTSTQLIGEGGSGYVYEVMDESNGIFAIKVLKKQNICEEKRKRFKNEIIFCERNTHPNIIKIIDYGSTNEDGIPIPFYVMPKFDSTLRKLMRNHLNPNQIISIFSQLLDGIEAAHLQGILHRDIKPENILFETSSSQLALSDFGIARFVEDEFFTAVETKDQDRLANFQYAAPEQRVRGKSVDYRADIYALGLILNEMFTHEIPQGTRYRKISSISSDFGYLDEIVDEMIRQSPDERIPSIKEVKNLLHIQGVANISNQRLSQYKNTVIQSNEIDDPLIINPLRIIDFEWENDELTLILNQKINYKWVSALNNMGSYTSLVGKGPEAFKFVDNTAKVKAREYDVQSIINYFKSWIPLATEKYKQILLDEIQKREESERQILQKKIEAEETKIRLRENIKL